MGKNLTVLCLILVLTVGSALAAVQKKRSEEEIAKIAIGAYQDGFYEVAKEELEDFLVSYPESSYVSQIKLMLLLTCLHLDECQEASLLWPKVGGKAALKKSGFSPPQLLLQLGICFFRELKFDQAGRYFQEIITFYPQGQFGSQARFFLIKMAFHQSHFDVAARHATALLAQKTLRLSPAQHKELLYFSGLSYYRTSKYKAALPLLKKYYNSYSGEMGRETKVFYYVVLIDAALKTTNLPLANHFLDLWLRSYPRAQGLTAALYLVGEANYHQQKPEKAHTYLQRLVSRSDLDPEQKRVAYGYLVNILLTGEHHDELIRYLEILIPLEDGLPEQQKHLKLLSILSYNQKDYKKSLASLSQLLRKFPETEKDEDVLFRFINAGLACGQCDVVTKTLSSHFDFSRVEHPDQQLLEAGYAYGLCLENEHLYPEAVRWLQHVYAQPGKRSFRIKVLAAMDRISLNSDNPELSQAVAKIIVRDFSLDKRDDEKLLKKYPYLVLTVATHFYQKQEYEQAIPSLLWLRGLTVENFPDLRRQVLFYLAECYFQQQQLNEAIPVYEELLAGAADRYRELAALRLAVLYNRQGYQKKKAALYRKLPEITGDSSLKKALKQKQ